jgi:hypothetical protein
MHIKLQLVILKVTDHFNDNSRSEITKINLTEIGSEVDSSGFGSRIVTYAFGHRNKRWVPGKGSFWNIFAAQEQIRSKEVLFSSGNHRLARYLTNVGRMGWVFALRGYKVQRL